MWTLGPAWEDEARLAERWRTATPFPHLVFDDFLSDDAMARLFAIVEEEPVETYRADIHAFDATAPSPTTDAFRDLAKSFAAAVAPGLGRITGKALSRVDMRAYAYRRGHYLLPHADHQPGVGRRVAYAFYLPSPEPPEDGALEMFRCDVEDGAIVRTESARIVEPRANRIVFFDVSDVSLHQVREVLAGLRISLAGWFYA